MPMIELPKAHEGGSFWLSTARIVSMEATARIVSMEATDSYGRYTTIRTDDGKLHSTRLLPARVAELIKQTESEE